MTGHRGRPDRPCSEWFAASVTARIQGFRRANRCVAQHPELGEVILRSWTMNTFSATAVAAVGLTSTGVASAATPMPAIPDGIPADIASPAPIHTCAALDNVGHGMEKAPCLDADLGVSVPNPAKKTDLGRSGVLGAAQETNGGLPRMVGGVVPTVATAKELIKTRPTIDFDLRPRATGVLEPKSGTGLLDAKIGPHRREQNGVSAVDTAADIKAVDGYNLQPGVAPLGMVKSLTTPAGDSQEQPPGVTPGKALEGGIGKVVGALGTALHATQSLA